MDTKRRRRKSVQQSIPTPSLFALQSAQTKHANIEGKQHHTAKLTSRIKYRKRGGIYDMYVKYTTYRRLFYDMIGRGSGLGFWGYGVVQGFGLFPRVFLVNTGNTRRAHDIPRMPYLKYQCASSSALFASMFPTKQKSLKTKYMCDCYYYYHLV